MGKGIRFAIAKGVTTKGAPCYMSRDCGRYETSLRSSRTWTTSDAAVAVRVVEECGGEIVEVQP